jgi:hypothetical protein
VAGFLFVDRRALCGATRRPRPVLDLALYRPVPDGKVAADHAAVAVDQAVGDAGQTSTGLVMVRMIARASMDFADALRVRQYDSLRSDGAKTTSRARIVRRNEA